MMYMGGEGIYSHTFEYEKEENCPVCSARIRNLTLDRKSSLKSLIESLVDGELRLRNPSIVGVSKTLYMPNPPSLEMMTRPNLDKPLEDLVKSGEEVTVTDSVFPGDLSLRLVINFE